MLKTRIIPCLDIKDGRTVKGVNFVELRDAGNPVELAKAYDAAGADELCFLDISATQEARATLYDMVEKVASQCFIPLTVGGGVRELADIRRLLNAGADKVSINSAAVARPEFVREAAEKFGNQCIVVAVDARRVGGDARSADRASPERERSEQPMEFSVENFGAKKEHAAGDSSFRWNDVSKKDSGQQTAPALSVSDSEQSMFFSAEKNGTVNEYEIFTHGGRKSTGLDAIKWARQMVDFGAGEILLTSMDKDGTKSGYDIAMTRAVADAVKVPVIASGGVGRLEDFVVGVREGHATGLLAASVFHYGEFSIAEVKETLRRAGIAVRLGG